MAIARRREQRSAETRARDKRIAALAIPALGALAVEPLYVLVDTATHAGQLDIVREGIDGRQFLVVHP